MAIHLTRGVKFILISCFVVFLIQQTGDQFLGTHLLGALALTSSDILHHSYFWQFVTYSFVHSDVMHLVFNLMMIAFIGGELEVLWGPRRFLQYYFFCTISPALIYFLLSTFSPYGTHMPMIGSSGAVYGLLLAYGILFGDRVLHFMMLFPMKAKHFVWLLVAIELLTTVYSSGGTWVGLAQLSGMAAGFAFLWVRTQLILAQKGKGQILPFGRPKKKRSQHLKLVVNHDTSSDPRNTDSKPKTWH